MVASDSEALRFVDDYCERELDPLLTPVTVDPAHPFPRVITSEINEELKKLHTAVHYGADTVMDLSTGGNIHEIREAILRPSRSRPCSRAASWRRSRRG